MRRPYIERKHFNEYFAPIVGFLRKNCGRPWDKVFSELGKSLTGGGTVIQHVKVHVLRDFVTLKPVWYGGVPCYPADRYPDRNGQPQPIEARFNRGFYVDRQGLLQRAPHKRRRKGFAVENAVPRIRIDENTAYYKLEGGWFRVWTMDLDAATEPGVPVYDVALKKWVRQWEVQSRWIPAESSLVWRVDGTEGLRVLQEFHGAYRIAYRKEQLSNRTIRREKLNELLR